MSDPLGYSPVPSPPISEVPLDAEPDRPEPLGDRPLGLPPAILSGLSEETLKNLRVWLDEQLNDLRSEQSEKKKLWAEYEEAYRALPQTPMFQPFEGSCNEVVPVIAMAVDPIVARLDTGIFKQKPVFTLTALRKSFSARMNSVNIWTEYYQRNRLKLRQVCLPRLVEFTKLGTMVLKTVYDRQSTKIKTYDPSDDWKVIEKEDVSFSGPRVLGLQLGNVLFHPGYESIQDCPIVAERQRVTWWNLKLAEHQGKLENVDKLLNQEDNQRDELETMRQEIEHHVENTVQRYGTVEIYEIWCDYDINGDGLPERLVVTYHEPTQTILQLRYNWYFHQRKPYTVIPYMVSNETLYGIGVCETVLPFQDAITRWHQMASNNAYIANIRMFIAKRNSGIEEVPRLYAGRTFFVDDPKSDFIPFGAGDIYPSTLAERQNMFGMVEKRTGVSDYLTGRESPVIGSRATATSTLALIQEGTRRVEEVLENIRVGLAEVMENCFYIWIQFGLDGLDDVVFETDSVATDLRQFFNSVDADNVNGAMAVDLTATDAASNKQARQQIQLQIIQVMITYLEKVIQLGAETIMAQGQGIPGFKELAVEVLSKAKNLFTDWLTEFDIRNPEKYIPELEMILNAIPAAGPGPLGAGGGPPGAPGQPGIPPGNGARPGPPVPRPAAPGDGGGPAESAILARLANAGASGAGRGR